MQTSLKMHLIVYHHLHGLHHISQKWTDRWASAGTDWSVNLESSHRNIIEDSRIQIYQWSLTIVLRPIHKYLTSTDLFTRVMAHIRVTHLSRISITSLPPYPILTAACSAVFPLLSRAFISAPDSSSVGIQSTYLFIVASTIAGVPCELTTDGSAPWQT